MLLERRNGNQQARSTSQEPSTLDLCVNPVPEEVSQRCYLMADEKICVLQHRVSSRVALIPGEQHVRATDEPVICHIGCWAALATWRRGLSGSLNFSRCGDSEKITDYELQP